LGGSAGTDDEKHHDRKTHGTLFHLIDHLIYFHDNNPVAALYEIQKSGNLVSDSLLKLAMIRRPGFIKDKFTLTGRS
jgi:hypothetical protein